MKTRQQGVAIVLAMGVVALAALTATAMMTMQSVWARQNELSAEHVQAKVLNQVGLDWTRALLSDDRRISNIDHLGEPWALKLPAVPVENGSLSGQVEDLQGRFNLNNIVKDGKMYAPQFEHFQRLLSALALPPELAAALADWIDQDHEPQAVDGAEDAYYLNLQPPYLAANGPLVDLDELKLVRGFDLATRQRLQPFVAALPKPTAVNVNTAAPEVLYAVIDGLTLNDAQDVVAQRTRTVFRERTDLLNQLPKDIKISPEDVTFSSDFFLVSLRVTIGQAEARSVALLARPNAHWPTVVWRKLQ